MRIDSESIYLYFLFFCVNIIVGDDTNDRDN